jgi:hypothetical protein
LESFKKLYDALKKWKDHKETKDTKLGPLLNELWEWHLDVEKPGHNGLNVLHDINLLARKIFYKTSLQAWLASNYVNNSFVLITDLKTKACKISLYDNCFKIDSGGSISERFELYFDVDLIRLKPGRFQLKPWGLMRDTSKMPRPFTHFRLDLRSLESFHNNLYPLFRQISSTSYLQKSVGVLQAPFRLAWYTKWVAQLPKPPLKEDVR